MGVSASAVDIIIVCLQLIGAVSGVARAQVTVAMCIYWFIDLLIGLTENVQRTSVIVDTGSSLCGFPCTGCTHCGTYLKN